MVFSKATSSLFGANRQRRTDCPDQGGAAVKGGDGFHRCIRKTGSRGGAENAE